MNGFFRRFPDAARIHIEDKRTHVANAHLRELEFKFPGLKNTIIWEVAEDNDPWGEDRIG